MLHLNPEHKEQKDELQAYTFLNKIEYNGAPCMLELLPSGRVFSGAAPDAKGNPSCDIYDFKESNTPKILSYTIEAKADENIEQVTDKIIKKLCDNASEAKEDINYFKNPLSWIDIGDTNNCADILTLAKDEYLYQLRDLKIVNNATTRIPTNLFVIYSGTDDAISATPVTYYNDNNLTISHIVSSGNQKFMVCSGKYTTKTIHRDSVKTEINAKLQVYDLWQKINGQYSLKHSWKIRWNKEKIPEKNNVVDTNRFFTSSHQIEFRHKLLAASDNELLLAVSIESPKWPYTRIFKNYLYIFNLLNNRMDEIALPPTYFGKHSTDTHCYQIPEFPELYFLVKKGTVYGDLFIFNSRSMQILQSNQCYISFINEKNYKNMIFLTQDRVLYFDYLDRSLKLIHFAYLTRYREARNAFRLEIKNELDISLGIKYVSVLADIILDYLDNDIREDNPFDAKLNQHYTRFFQSVGSISKVSKLQLIENFKPSCKSIIF